MHGHIQYFNTEKKFGFVRIHPDIADFYFDGRQVIGEIKWGDRVSFWLDDGRRGELIAIEVKRLSGTPSVLGLRKKKKHKMEPDVRQSLDALNREIQKLTQHVVKLLQSDAGHETKLQDLSRVVEDLVSGIATLEQKRTSRALVT